MMKAESHSLELRRFLRHVLVVEDSIIIAMDAEEQLVDLGAERVTLAASVGEALEEIGRLTPTLALLDVKLQDETCFPIADKLKELHVPYIFATGYTYPASFPDLHKQAPCMTKPYSGEALGRTIGDLVREDKSAIQSLQRTG